jgi:hypothetical protein
MEYESPTIALILSKKDLVARAGVPLNSFPALSATFPALMSAVVMAFSNDTA